MNIVVCVGAPIYVCKFFDYLAAGGVASKTNTLRGILFHGVSTAQ